MDVLSNQIDQFVSILYRSRHSNGSLKEKNKSLKKIDLAWSAYNTTTDTKSILAMRSNMVLECTMAPNKIARAQHCLFLASKYF